MKKCPFCAEEIQDDAIKCRYCNEFLIDAQIRRPAEKEKVHWLFSTPGIVIALLCVGPFALPLVWLHPRYKIVTKAVVTSIVVAVSIWAFFITRDLWRGFREQFDSIGVDLY